MLVRGRNQMILWGEKNGKVCVVCGWVSSADARNERQNGVRCAGEEENWGSYFGGFSRVGGFGRGAAKGMFEMSM